MITNYITGRGAQLNTPVSFQSNKLILDFPEAVNQIEGKKTMIYKDYPLKIISENQSPDIPFKYSINPYQGCEHGCIYCYARNTHEYWGLSAGLDFETKIISKPEAPEMLRKELTRPLYKPEMIMLSGNTDCYQPAERKLKITRRLLQVLFEFRNPVTIITKNVLVLRDMDILREMARYNLIHIIFSISTLDEKLRLKLEPRTASGWKKLKAIKILSDQKIPVSVMLSPVIPAINNHEIPSIIRQSAEMGARNIHMTKVRLNGKIAFLFKDWLEKNYPQRVEKVWNQISSLHGGTVNESKWGTRMTGSGKMAESIDLLFKTVKNHYFPHPAPVELSTHLFRRQGMNSLFETIDNVAKQSALQQNKQQSLFV